MPFTPTHILAIVPIGHIWPRKFAFSALVIGSMVPDWPLFIPVGPTYRITHSFVGLFSVCVPLGLAIYLLFQSVIKRPMFELLPQGLRQKLGHIAAPTIPIRVKQWGGAIVAIAIGAFTHIVWDAFTHQGQWGNQLIPALNRTVLTIAGQPIPGYKVLQYSSSLVGLPILFLCLLLWLRSAPTHVVPPSPLPSAARKAAIAISSVVPVVACLWPVVQLLSSPISYDAVTEAIVSGVILAGGVLLLWLGLYSLSFYPLVRLQKRQIFQNKH